MQIYSSYNSALSYNTCILDSKYNLDIYIYILETRFVSKEENADDTMLISYDIKKKSKEGMLALNTTYHLKSDFDKLPEYTWTHFETKGEKPPPLSRHSAVVYGRRMIIFGGCYLDMQCFNHIYYLNLE